MSDAIGDNTIHIGIDLGGTKIEGIALSDDGETLARKRVDTPSGNYPQTLRAICDLIRQIEFESESTGSIGIGIPGSLDKDTNLVRNANSTCLNGKALKHDLENCLQTNIQINNDANCFILSEATDGAAQNFATVFGVILGTGTGGAISLNKQVLPGRNGLRGEWGHNPLPWPTLVEASGPSCFCGKHGCIETYLSGPGLSHDHLLQSGQKLDPKQIAQSQDSSCIASIERYCNRLARALASVINLLDPDAIVLGGGLSQIEQIYTLVPQQWGQYIFSGKADTPLLRPTHGDASGVRGAAWIGIK